MQHQRRFNWVMQLMTTLLKKWGPNITRRKPKTNDIAQTIRWVATALPEDITGGGYYVPPGIAGQISALGKHDGLGSDLWAWTQRIVTALPYEGDTCSE
jgi:hypothetical protein